MHKEGSQLDSVGRLTDPFMLCKIAETDHKRISVQSTKTSSDDLPPKTVVWTLDVMSCSMIDRDWRDTVSNVCTHGTCVLLHE